ncbi:MAG: hypothetical protein K9K40_07950 [Desulfotignum sp.]|nr:hypothetical protein [Desulfotignum sp.]
MQKEAQQESLCLVWKQAGPAYRREMSDRLHQWKKALSAQIFWSEKFLQGNTAFTDFTLRDISGM